MRIGIIVAMDVEYRNLCASLGGHECGLWNNGRHEVRLLQCGIGKVNAAVGTTDMIKDFQPQFVLSTGLAGGVASTVDRWDAVVAERTAYHDVFCGMGNEYGQVQGQPLFFRSDAGFVETAMSVANKVMDGQKVHKGLICTGDQFITNREALDKIASVFPDVLACDMESAAIAHVCHIKNVPFLSLRIISDTPGRTADHKMQWEEALRLMGDHSFRIVESLLNSL